MVHVLLSSHLPLPLTTVCLGLPSSLFQLLRFCKVFSACTPISPVSTDLISLLFMPLFLPPVGPDYKCDEHTEFSCKTNYRCVPQWARCDGTNDCIDNSDEEGCGQSLSVSFCGRLSCSGHVSSSFCKVHEKLHRRIDLFCTGVLCHL